LVAKARKELTVAASADGSRALVFEFVLSDQWKAYCAYQMQNGHPVLASLQIYPRGDLPQGGLKMSDLRDIKRDDLLSEARRRLNEPTHAKTRELASFVTKKPPTGRRRSRTALECARIADRYVELCQQTSKPIVLLAKEQEMDRDQVRALINDLRNRNFLTRGQQGRAGGALTDKAKTILAEADRTGVSPRRRRASGSAPPRTNRDVRNRD
jgi:hypothetical protein